MKPFKRYAKALYRLFSTGLSILSTVKPLFRLALRILTGRGRQMRGHILPVNAALGEPEQSPLSRNVLEVLIGRSAAVAAMNECLCRTVGGCTVYPADIGCLVLGDAARALHPGLGRAVSREQALALADRALGLGLTPMVIHFRGDAALWSLEHSRMLTICFCCPCHCLIREALRHAGDGKASVTGLPSIAIAFDAGACRGCGRCAKACFIGSLRVKDGRPAIDTSSCVSCGRCAMACPNGALHVRVSEDVAAASVVQDYEQLIREFESQKTEVRIE